MPRPTIGSYVAWNDGSGLVELVVARGTVPGVPGTATAAEGPLARVQVWQRTDSGWRPTEERKALAVGDLVEVPHLAAPEQRAQDASTKLVALVTAHQQLADHLNLPPWSRPDGMAVKTVFERGRASWPGHDVTDLTAEEWALGRVEAFYAVASGATVNGYRRDLDQLPLNHPARDSG
uniref:hypothetical protein n=1 Tax=Nonomuraea sp. CA-251285 TaxID=3240002 RepID=UPI003F495053